MTLIKLKDILLENVSPEERKQRLMPELEIAAGSAEAPAKGAELKKYLTAKAKEISKEFKGNILFKEYRISSAILQSAGDNHQIVIGLKPKDGGEGLIPIKMHVYGKKYFDTLGKFEFVESAWKVGQYLEPAGGGTVKQFIELFKAVYGEREQWEKRDIQFITPAGEKTLDDFTGEGSEDDSDSAAGGGIEGGQVRKKDFASFLNARYKNMSL